MLILYAPGIPKLLYAIRWNVGENAGRSQNIASISAWVREAFFAFGADADLMAYGLALLALVGLGALIRRGDWRLLAYLVGGIVLPIALIAAFKVSRWASAKYVIYILPPYLVRCWGRVGCHSRRDQAVWGTSRPYRLHAVILLSIASFGHRV